MFLPHLGGPNSRKNTPSLRNQSSSLGPSLSLKVRSMKGCFGPQVSWTCTIMHTHPYISTLRYRNPPMFQIQRCFVLFAWFREQLWFEISLGLLVVLLKCIWFFYQHHKGLSCAGCRNGERKPRHRQDSWVGCWACTKSSGINHQAAPKSFTGSAAVSPCVDRLGAPSYYALQVIASYFYRSKFSGCIINGNSR